MAEIRFSKPLPKARRILPNVYSEFSHENVNIQVARQTGPGHNKAVYAIFPNGRTWHVPVMAPLESAAPTSSKTKRKGRKEEKENDSQKSKTDGPSFEVEESIPPISQEKPKKEKSRKRKGMTSYDWNNNPNPQTVVFLKDAVTLPRSPLSAAEKEEFKTLLEITRKKLRWPAIRHVEIEQRVAGRGPKKGQRERRQQDKKDTKKEPRHTIMDTVRGIRPVLVMEKKDREEEEVRQVANDMAQTLWFTNFAHERLREAGFSNPKEHTEHMRGFAQTNFRKLLGKANRMGFHGLAEKTRETAVIEAINALKKEKG